MTFCDLLIHFRIREADRQLHYIIMCENPDVLSRDARPYSSP